MPCGLLVASFLFLTNLAQFRIVIFNFTKLAALRTKLSFLIHQVYYEFISGTCCGHGVFVFSKWKLLLSCFTFYERRFCPARMVVIIGSLFRWPILLVGMLCSTSFCTMLFPSSVSFHPLLISVLPGGSCFRKLSFENWVDALVLTYLHRMWANHLHLEDVHPPFPAACFSVCVQLWSPSSFYCWLMA